MPRIACSARSRSVVVRRGQRHGQLVGRLEDSRRRPAPRRATDSGSAAGPPAAVPLKALTNRVSGSRMRNMNCWPLRHVGERDVVTAKEELKWLAACDVRHEHVCSAVPPVLPMCRKLTCGRGSRRRSRGSLTRRLRRAQRRPQTPSRAPRDRRPRAVHIGRALHACQRRCQRRGELREPGELPVPFLERVQHLEALARDVAGSPWLAGVNTRRAPAARRRGHRPARAREQRPVRVDDRVREVELSSERRTSPRTP